MPGSGLPRPMSWYFVMYYQTVWRASQARMRRLTSSGRSCCTKCEQSSSTWSSRSDTNLSVPCVGNGERQLTGNQHQFALRSRVFDGGRLEEQPANNEQPGRSHQYNSLTFSSGRPSAESLSAYSMRVGMLIPARSVARILHCISVCSTIQECADPANGADEHLMKDSIQTDATLAA